MLRTLATLKIPYNKQTHPLFNALCHALSTFDNDMIPRDVVGAIAAYSDLNWGALYTLRRTNKALRQTINDFLRSDQATGLLKSTIEAMSAEVNPDKSHQLHALIQMLHSAGVHPTQLENILKYTQSEAHNFLTQDIDADTAALTALYQSTNVQDFYRSGNTTTTDNKLSAELAHIRYLESRIEFKRKYIKEKPSISSEELHARVINNTVIIMNVLSILDQNKARHIKGLISNNLIQAVIEILLDIKSGFLFTSKIDPTFVPAIAILQHAEIENSHKALLILLLLTTRTYGKMNQPIAKVYPKGLLDLLTLFKTAHFTENDVIDIDRLFVRAMTGQLTIDKLVAALQFYTKITATIVEGTFDQRQDRCKALIVGSEGAGRSSFLLSLINMPIPGYLCSTNQSTFEVAYAGFADKILKLELWDVAKNRYPSSGDLVDTNTQNVGGAHAAIVCYDVTDQTSFAAVERYVAQLRGKIVQCNTPIILVGCKLDLVSQKVVDYSQGKALAEGLQLAGFYECSAHNKMNLDAVLTALARGFYNLMQQTRALTASESPSSRPR